MTTLSRHMMKFNQFVDNIAVYSGVDRGLVANIVQYAKCLRDPPKTDIDRTVFCAQMSSQFDLTNAFLIQLMFDSLKERRLEDTLTLESFCKCICTFVSSDLDLKINYVYSVYDVDSDGQISYPELHKLLRHTIIHNEGEYDVDFDDSLKELIDLAVRILDIDSDSIISREDFAILVRRKPFVLQCLGPCLPQEHALDRFVGKLTGKSPYQVRMEFMNERIISLNTVPSRLYKPHALYPIHLDLP